MTENVLSSMREESERGTKRLEKKEDRRKRGCCVTVIENER